jgi:hypothetical protein
MVIERLHSGFVVAPDFKVTEVDRTTSAARGGYAGWLTDEDVLHRRRRYWLANQASDRKMAYGGLVLQLLARTDRRVGFGVKGLIGGGRATLGTTVTQIPGFPRSSQPSGPAEVRHRYTTVRCARQRRAASGSARGSSSHEPQVCDGQVNPAKLRLTGGAGLTRPSMPRGRDDRRLVAPPRSLGLQIGG